MGEVEIKEHLLDLLGDLLSLRKEIKKKKESTDEDTRSPSDRQLIEDMQKDLNAFFKWALGMEEKEGIKHSDLAPTWRKLHPDLPVPRVALLEHDVDPSFTLFIMEGYPLYLKHKEKE